MIYECENCQKPLSAGMLFCPYCGEKFPIPVPEGLADAETHPSTRLYQDALQPQVPQTQAQLPLVAEKKKRPFYINILATIGALIVLFWVIGLFAGNSQRPANSVGTTEASPSTVIPTSSAPSMPQKHAKPKQVAEKHTQALSSDQQKPARHRRTIYSGKLPAVTISPTLSFRDNTAVLPVDSFINHAYPGCKINSDYSDRHSWVVDYKVTEPNGRKVYAVCSFVWNGGGLPDDWANTPGHYELTEGRNEAEAEEKADEKDKLAQANQHTQVAQTQQPKAVQGNEDDVYSAIKAKVRRDFPNDYFMQKSTYDLEVRAYHYMQSLPDDEIKAKVQQDFPDDYFMQKSTYELQLKSKQDMQ